MATVQQAPSAGAAGSDQAVKEAPQVIPEFIEERRRDGERVVTIKYAVGKLLGKGGFAKCFLGVQLPSKTQYAIKIVSKSTLSKSRARQKLQTEIKIHRSLSHVNVVRFDRYFEDVDNAYILLELCHNNSMSELMKRRKKLTEPEVRFYLVQLVESLQFLHSALVIHRDLKLGNLFLDRNMRIKVGDFGLAARLTTADERRRTICGTPNYIAPEILEGKEGHSFEVDTWSTGVIMYTLLVGKPPFESKDVKSTYKRILANQYSFPDHTTVCEHAKNLIKHLLQPRPENRPRIDTILQHTFFTRSAAYTPSFLPESCLRDAPQFPLTTDSMQYHGSHGSQFNDENDATAINRANSASATSSMAGRFDAPLLKPAASYGIEKKPVLEAARSRSAAPSSSQSQALGERFEALDSQRAPTSGSVSAAAQPRRPQVPARSTSTAGPLLSSRTTTAAQAWTSDAAASSTDGASTATTTSTAPATSAAQQGFRMQTRSLSAAPMQTNSDAGYSRKFEIYSEKRSTPTGSGSGSVRERSPPQQAELERRPTSASNVAGTSGSSSSRSAFERRDSADSTSGKSSGSHPQKHQQYSSATMEHIQQDLEGFNIREDRSRASAASAPLKPTQDAWSVRSEKESAPSSSSSARASDRYQSQQQQQQLMSPTVDTQMPQGGAQYAAMQLATPPEQVIKDKAPLNTLETMHEVLSTCGGGLDDDSLLGDMNYKPVPLPASAQLQAARRRELFGQAATVWVVRHVDYTSKYGLGFLLNTGSAGVYFNDSTKIVLSADGKVFQYIERKRREAGAAASSSGSASEHTVQTHLLSRFPVELQKKVTLLCHFRNYLIEQERSAATEGGEDTGAAVMAAGTSEVAAGACADVMFGVSSARYTAPPGSSSSSSGGGCDLFGRFDSETEPEMPFLKKWVRTRHAILFRLSNRTVQVVFFDRSEILLSSEARIVTYVSKVGDRSEHSLEEVLQTGRKDIAKRLKYTKDIMFRLINIQAK